MNWNQFKSEFQKEVKWNPFALEPPLRSEEGLIIAFTRIILAIPAYVLNRLHRILRLLVSLTVKSPGAKREVCEGYFIEVYVLACAAINAFIVLPYFAGDNWSFLSIAFIFLVLRSADFLDTFITINFYLSYQYRLPKEAQQSVARSYALLISNFLEAAAIFASLHFIICGRFVTGNYASHWGNLYYYSIMNLLTIGDSSSVPASSESLWWFNFFKVVQPLFGALFLAAAISRIIDWKRQPEPKKGNGT